MLAGFGVLWLSEVEGGEGMVFRMGLAMGQWLLGGIALYR
jgi:hypothetical protein